MGKRKEPASEVVSFFETASVETAETVLAICKGVVARRKPKGAVPRKRQARGASTEPATEQS